MNNTYQFMYQDFPIGNEILLLSINYRLSELSEKNSQINKVN